MALTWAYKDFWEWFQQADTVSKRNAWEELIKDNWLGNVSANVQKEVLEFAPQDVRRYARMLDFIKPEVKINLMFDRR